MSAISTPNPTRAIPGESAGDFLKRMKPLMIEATRLGIPRELPGYISLSLAAYLSHHQRPDTFLQRVLENDLFGALDEATSYEASILPALARWIREHAPVTAAGSKENVRAWLERDGV